MEEVLLNFLSESWEIERQNVFLYMGMNGFNTAEVDSALKKLINEGTILEIEDRLIIG